MSELVQGQHETNEAQPDAVNGPAAADRRARQLWYGPALAAAVAVLVAIQVLPKLEQYALRAGGEPIEVAAGASATFAGSTWRLISVTPAADQDLPEGAEGVTAVIGVEPRDERASKALAKGCAAAVRDSRDRLWTSTTKVKGVEGVSTLCTEIDDKTYKPILVPPGTEVRWQASFAVPADALSSLRVEVRLEQRDVDFLRLTPPAAPSAEPPRAD